MTKKCQKCDFLKKKMKFLALFVNNSENLRLGDKTNAKTKQNKKNMFLELNNSLHNKSSSCALKVIIFPVICFEKQQKNLQIESPIQ